MESDRDAFMAVVEAEFQRKIDDIKADLELELIWGPRGWRKYMCSFKPKDKPRGVGKLRGKRRKLAIRDAYRRAETILRT